MARSVVRIHPELWLEIGIVAGTPYLSRPPMGLPRVYAVPAPPRIGPPVRMPSSAWARRTSLIHCALTRHRCCLPIPVLGVARKAREVRPWAWASLGPEGAPKAAGKKVRLLASLLTAYGTTNDTTRSS